jgi:hypothetical protein
MVAYHAYRPGLLEPANGRKRSLLYFAATVPTVGFVHGAADLNPFDTAAFEDYAESRFIKRAQRRDIAPQTSKRSPLGLRWLV